MSHPSNMVHINYQYRGQNMGANAQARNAISESDLVARIAERLPNREHSIPLMAREIFECAQLAGVPALYFFTRDSTSSAS